ncbi:PD-(D/E)XK nuclease family protein, partial [bacterium]|nr:PD-(D/E)XK nuclease family protein [bacterium]
PAQTFGNIIHKTLKNFYQQQLVEKEKLPLSFLLEIMERNWTSEGFPSKIYEKKAKAKAKKILRNFYKTGFNYQKIGQVVALEQPFSFRLTPTLKIGGKIDRVDNISGDKIEIIDYKTGSNRLPSQKEVDKNRQLTIYAMAVSTLKDFPFSRPVEKIVLSLWFLDAGIKVSSQRTAEDIEKAKEEILKLVEELEKTDFPPKPNRPFPCDYCEYKLLCDAWR